MKDFKISLDILEDYLEKKYDVTVLYRIGEGNILSHNDEYGEKLIVINPRHSRKIQLYCLLHEAGHVTLRETKDKHLTRFSNSIKNKNSIAYRVDVVREEILAWEEGFEISKKLKFEIDFDDWLNYNKKHIFEYIKWSLDPKEYMKTIYM